MWSISNRKEREKNKLLFTEVECDLVYFMFDQISVYGVHCAVIFINIIMPHRWSYWLYIIDIIDCVDVTCGQEFMFSKRRKEKKISTKVLLLCAEEGPKALCLSLILYNIMSVSDIMRFVLLLPIFPRTLLTSGIWAFHTRRDTVNPETDHFR